MIMQVCKNVMDMLTNDARRRFTITTTSLLPSMVMTFVTIQALRVTGLLKVVGQVCEPVTALWELPRESVTVLLTAVMNTGGGVGVCASLVVVGTLSGHDAMVLLPAIYLTGNPVQNVDCCLGAAGVHPHHYSLTIATCVINAPLSIWVMQVIARQGRL